MFEIPAFLPPNNLGPPMHSPSALTEHVSLNLLNLTLNKVFFCSTLYNGHDLFFSLSELYTPVPTHPPVTPRKNPVAAPTPTSPVAAAPPTPP